ncbi:MAG TPA: sulfurtransferase [Gemmatimonadales bacterium]|nr:sulfurtransferase [Gemmatimonadales bacterium]
MTQPQSTPPLIGVDQLATMLGAPGVAIVDGSWYLPSSGRNPDADYAAAHIPGAMRLPLERISDPDSTLPHMLPSAVRFASACEEIGIGPRHHVIVYDGSGVNLSAARIWWTFRAFGHSHVSVLDGGILAWAGATRPIQVGVQRPVRTGYPVPQVDAALVVDRATIDRVVAGNEPGQIADCRSEDRFHGRAAEPRPGLRRGNIPGSVNTPFGQFTDQATGLMHGPERLRQILAERGLDPSRRIISSCGSGVTACVLALAVEVIRASDPGAVGPPVAVYDGSWAEYGQAART